MTIRRQIFIALVIPFAAVLIPMPFLASLDWMPLGIPVALAWMFCCLPLTTLCLIIAGHHQN